MGPCKAGSLMYRSYNRYLTAVVVAVFVAQQFSAQSRGDLVTQRVSGPGSLDWAYVLTGSSPADAPVDQFSGYAWQRQSYDFFHPNKSFVVKLSRRLVGTAQSLCLRHGFDWSEK